MNAMPQSPEEFIVHWLPDRFARARAAMGLGTLDSPGCIVFQILDSARAWTLSIKKGELSVVEEDAADPVIRVVTTTESFVGLVAGVRDPSPDSVGSLQLNMVKNLVADPARAQLVKNLAGSLAFEVREPARALRIVLVPGSCAPNAAPSCTLRISAEDFAQLKAGTVQPFQLLMQGKLAIEGDAQIAMMLGTSLV